MERPEKKSRKTLRPIQNTNKNRTREKTVQSDCDFILLHIACSRVEQQTEWHIRSGAKEEIKNRAGNFFNNFTLHAQEFAAIKLICEMLSGTNDMHRKKGHITGLRKGYRRSFCSVSLCVIDSLHIWIIIIIVLWRSQTGWFDCCYLVPRPFDALGQWNRTYA